MAELDAALARIKGRWLGGGRALEAAPAGWEAVAGNGAGAELRLLALAGQALETRYRPAAAGALAFRPPLPQLALPSLADERRSLLRRALAAAGKSAEEQCRVLELLAARGWSAHPADWMPSSASAQAPDLYAPWVAWLEGGDRSGARVPLTAENWQDWDWRERLAKLAALRARDPAEARELVQAVAHGEPADRRQKLAALLSLRLSEDDVPFLESLTEDRSERVRAEARKLLARLGRFDAAGEAAAELAAFLEVARTGSLKPAVAVTTAKLAANSQQARRSELFATVPLAALAVALGLSETALIEAWSPGAQQLPTQEFAAMVAETGSDAAHVALLARAVRGDAFPPTVLPLVVGRLATDDRAALVVEAFREDGDPSLAAALALAGPQLGRVDQATIACSRAWAALTEFLGRPYSERKPAEAARVAAGLHRLGLLCTAEAAEWVIDRLCDRGLSPVGSGIDILMLNAALKETPDQ